MSKQELDTLAYVIADGLPSCGRLRAVQLGEQQQYETRYQERQRLRTEFDVTLPRFDLMAQLDRAPNGMTLGELSQRMMVSNGNVTGLVERLVSLNLVERRPAPNDRRAMIVTLTVEGRRTFRSLARTHEGWIAEIFGELNQTEIDTLMKLLAKTKNSARKAIDKGAAR